MPSRPAVVLAALLLFLGLGIGVRLWLHYRQTGQSGFHGLSGKPFSAAWFGGLAFATGTIASVAAPILAWTGTVGPLWDPAPAQDALAAVLATGSFAGVWWSQSCMGASWAIGVRDGMNTSLVTGIGPYRYVRNPIYSFMLAAGLGFVLALPSLAAMVSLALIGLGFEAQVRLVEEPYLRRTHGEAYARYCEQAGRFFPGLK